MKHEPFFTDSGELDHVLYLLAEDSKLADIPLSDEKEALHLANSAIPPLKKRLRDELIKSNIEPGEIVDANELFHLLSLPSLNEYQEVCAEALITVYTIDSFSELDERLEELKGQLKEVYIKSADGPLFAVNKTSLAQKKRAQKDRQSVLNKEIVGIIERNGMDISAKQILKKLEAMVTPGGDITDITETTIEYTNNGETKTEQLSSFDSKVSKLKKKLEKKNPK